MIKVEVELHEDVISILNKLKSTEDTGIELVVPDGAVLFENVLNLKLIKSWSDREGKVINFNTDDINGQNMLMYLENGGALSESFDEEGVETLEPDTKGVDKNIPRKKLVLPKIKFPRIRLKGRLPIIIAALLLLLVIGGVFAYKFMSEIPKAEVTILVNAQPLTRSFEIKVKNGVVTDVEQKLLKGSTVQASLDDKLTIETTGEKIIGEKAKGRITIYNKTSEEKKFEKGEELKSEDDDDLVYVLDDTVTVPPSTPEDPSDPGSLLIPGQADADVLADKIGDKYNLKEDNDLIFDDYDEDAYAAEVVEDIDGGKEEKISTVAQEDIDTLKTSLLENTQDKNLLALNNTVTEKEKLISGSENTGVSKEAFSHSLDEETEELTLEQTFVTKGLVYETEELDKLIDKVVEDFVPEGFVLSTKERVVNVEILGNTEDTVLSDTEADVQVTLKTFVVPDISEDSIKKELMGKSVNEAQKILGSIRNVKTYEFNLSPRVPFFDYVPRDENRIKITLERE